MRDVALALGRISSVERNDEKGRDGEKRITPTIHTYTPRLIKRKRISKESTPIYTFPLSAFHLHRNANPLPFNFHTPRPLLAHDLPPPLLTPIRAIRAHAFERPLLGLHLLRRQALLLFLRLLRHSRKPVEEQRAHDIDPDVHPEDAEIPPHGIVLRVYRLQKDIRVAHGAIRAVTCCIIVDGVPAVGSFPGSHVRPACFSLRGVEVQEFVVGAADAGVCDADAEHAGDHVGEGGDAVHEDPEAGELFGGGEDTAEDEAEGEGKVGDVAACFGHFDT